MAVNAATVWEWRATNGSNTNGGGFYDADPGTSVDYSNQNSAQESYTTLATSGAGITTVTCGGADTFDAGIAGNVIYISSGTNFTAGWYQVTTRNSSTSIVVDRSPTPSGAGSSGVGNMGGALALFTDAFLDDTNYQLPGVKNWIKNDGTMTLTGTIDLGNVDGTVALPIEFEGYNSSRGDDPTGTNRPLIDCDTYDFIVDDYNHFKHLRMTGTGTYVLQTGIAGYVYNCDLNNTSGSANRYAFYDAGTRSRLVGCELQSVNGYCVRGAGTDIVGCYLHDSSMGVQCDANDVVTVNSVIDTCATGIDINTRNGCTVVNCTIYNSTTRGIDYSTGYGLLVINCIIDGCAVGAHGDSELKNNIFDYNCWDNTSDTNNVTKGENAVTGDPSLTDPANGDFTKATNSNCIDAALDAGDLTGATV